MGSLKTGVLILSVQKVLLNVFIIYRMKTAPTPVSMNPNQMFWIFISKKRNYKKWFSAAQLPVPSGPSDKKALQKCGCQILNGWRQKDPKQSLSSSNSSLAINGRLLQLALTFFILFAAGDALSSFNLIPD